MKLHSAILVLISSLVIGCASASPAQVSPYSSGEKEQARSICELVNGEGLAEGMLVRLAAEYRTDKSHYAYLIDPSCGKEGVISISVQGAAPDDSVNKFYASSDQLCLDRGTPYICVLSANVTADVKIVRSESGEFEADLLKVYVASFK